MGYPQPPNVRTIMEKLGLGVLFIWVSQDLLRWARSVFNPDNSYKPPHIYEADAAKDCDFYSIDAGKRAYKDSAGTVHYFY